MSDKILIRNFEIGKCTEENFKYDFPSVVCKISSRLTRKLGIKALSKVGLCYNNGLNLDFSFPC